MSHDTFMQVFTRSVSHEGGYQCHYDDRGNWTSGKVGQGELKGTKYGISAMSYPHLDIKQLSHEQAAAVYYQDWWCVLDLDRFLPAIQYQLFDAAINHGMHHCTRMLQRAVGAADDGKIGPQTLKAVAASDLNDLLMRFLAERLEFMTKVNTWPQFGKGWARRVADNLRYAARDN